VKSFSSGQEAGTDLGSAGP